MASLIAIKISVLLPLLGLGQVQNVARDPSQTPKTAQQRLRLPDELANEVARLGKIVRNALVQSENLDLITEAIPAAERVLSIRQAHQGRGLVGNHRRTTSSA